MNRYRAVFGLGFIVLGALTLRRVAISSAPPNNKIFGVVFAFALIGLGAARVLQYARLRRGLDR